jgi:hypothetical protein
MLQKSFPQLLAWAALVVMCSAMAPAQAAGARSDGQIEMDVVKALDASQTLKDDLITAATIQSEVTLAGTVSSEASRALAESITAQVPGVTKVNNNLKVGNPQDAQTADNQADIQMNSQSDAQDAAVQPGPGPDNGPAPYQQTQAPYQSQGPDRAQAPYPPPPARPQYAPARRMPYEAPKGPLTVPQGTLLQLRTNEPVNARHAMDGTPVQFMMISDVIVGGYLAIPRGAIVHGVVTERKRTGALSGRSELALNLVSLDLGRQSYPLDTDQFKVKGPNKAGRTASNALGGALLGAIIGGAAGRGFGAAVGAGAGAAAGTAASAATPGPDVWIPTEALMEFHLNTPLTVQPVSAEEAVRLAEGLYPGGPALYRRGYPPYPYGYPPVSYRPYYVTGGYYYWR